MEDDPPGTDDHGNKDEESHKETAAVQILTTENGGSTEVFYNTIEISTDELNQQLEEDHNNANKAGHGGHDHHDDGSHHHYKFEIIGAEEDGEGGAELVESYKLVDLEQVQNFGDREVIIINADNLQIEPAPPPSSVTTAVQSGSSAIVKSRRTDRKSSLLTSKPKFILPQQIIQQPEQQQQQQTTSNFILTSLDGKTFQLAPVEPTQNLMQQIALQASPFQQYLLPQNLTFLQGHSSATPALEILPSSSSIIQHHQSIVQPAVTVVNHHELEKVANKTDGQVQILPDIDESETGVERPKENEASKTDSAAQSFVVTTNSSDTGQNVSTANTINVSVPGMPGVVCQLQRYLYTPGLCRVCLLVKNDLVSIFEDVSIASNGLIENSRGPHAANKYNIIPAIKTLLDIEVNFGDGLPEQICADCIDNLTAFSVFRKRIAIGQSRLQEILAQVQGSATATVIPELGEIDMKRTDVFRHAEHIIQAKQILSNSSYSHLVVRNISDRVWEKIFQSLSVMVGYKSGKLKSLEGYAVDQPFANGWFCYSCNLTIHGPKELFAQHNVEAHGVRSAEEVLFPCDICAHSFMLHDASGISQSYGDHWLQHFFFFECNECNRRMPSQKGLWVHKRSAHTSGEKVFRCTDCDKSFFKKAHLDAHRKTHMGPEERKRHLNWCKICGKGLTSSLSAHIASVHSTDRPWKCEICNKQFKRKEILNGHREAVHFNLKKYQCELCGEYLKSHSTKALHILRHKGEKPHACPVCDKRFYSAHSMKSHMVKHQNVGKVKCSICGKVFKRKLYLVEHMRLHTGEKPHECHICGKQIRMKSNFFKHLKVHKRREAEKLAKEMSDIS